jgi:predicted nucleic acid-binding Zn ribbon protein
MNIKKSDVFNGIFIECPHCRVCSFSISDNEYRQIESGQLMMTTCQVCGKEVLMDETLLR